MLLRFTTLHWNPHFECFHDMTACGDHAIAFVDALLTSMHNSIDFASLIELNTPYIPPSSYSARGGQVCREGWTDDLLLIFNSRRWLAEGSAVMGCLTPGRKDARGYIVQPFRHKQTQIVLTVVAVHYPHPGSEAWPMAIRQLRSAIGRTNHLLLLADANVDFDMPTASLMRELGYKTSSTQTASLWRTCCFSDGFKYASDRIATNFGTLISEARPMPAPFPAWVSHKAGRHHNMTGSLTGGNEMHLPMLATFNYLVPQRDVAADSSARSRGRRMRHVRDGRNDVIPKR